MTIYDEEHIEEEWKALSYKEKKALMLKIEKEYQENLVRFDSAFQEVFYYHLGGGQEPIIRIIAWALFPIVLLNIFLIASSVKDCRRLDDPRKKTKEQ